MGLVCVWGTQSGRCRRGHGEMGGGAARMDGQGDKMEIGEK